MLAPRSMKEMSEVEVVNRELYESNIDGTSLSSRPMAYGVLDRRMGMSIKKARCDTCGLELADCVGHFGHVQLALPVFHVGYFKKTMTVLQCICKTCSRVLLPEEERRMFSKRLRNSGLDSVQRAAILKSVYTACRKVATCPFCGSTNGILKRIPPLKIIHEKFRLLGIRSREQSIKQERRTIEEALIGSGILGGGESAKSLVGKAQDEIHPLRCLALFEAILGEDLIYLGFEEPPRVRPEWLLWQTVLVPPACIRPSVEQEGGSNEDDITIKLTDIVYTNMIIKEALDKGTPVQALMGDWEYLQLQIALYVNSALPGVPTSMQLSSRPMRGFVQRLNGKQGRFRGNLSGKRVDFSGRTVISPDPNLEIGHVGIPIDVAKMLTYPERATAFNIESLRAKIIRGPEEHPGAVFVQQGSFKKQLLRAPQREKIAQALKVGDVVERHLSDGDLVLFNRQPSLHKLSIMAHRARVRPWKTFRFNECACAPFNADFDGDEMNIHFPQTEEAKAEASTLMDVKNNLVTPRNGQPVIAATQDFLTTAFLLTRRDVFLTKRQVCQFVTYMYNAMDHVDLPEPALIKPRKLWTGKQVFSLLIRPNVSSPILVNVEMKNRNFTKTKVNYLGLDVASSLQSEFLPMEFCHNEGFLIIRNSEIIAGTLDKSNVGDGSKNALFYVLLRDYGPQASTDAMVKLSRFSARWIGDRGFSIGIDDVSPGAHLRSKKDELVEAGYIQCSHLIDSYNNNKLALLPGCDAAQSLESSLSGILSRIREDVGSICLDELSKHNAPWIMQACGSKGSKINVSQMVSCVGQQIVSGTRIPDGFTGRSLPHFPICHAKEPAAKGFVRSSFFSGLQPPEFFFHAMGGREGLIDTAVKTAETGYMQRRLMKALEDLSVHYDLSVRNAYGSIVQFIYGADGLDPAEMEGDNCPVAFSRTLTHAKNSAACHSADLKALAVLFPDEIRELVEQFKKSYSSYSFFVDSLVNFVEKYVIKPTQDIRASFGLPGHIASTAKNDQWLEQKLQSLFHLTRSQFLKFLELCSIKMRKAQIEPGTAVGALGAQSIGEPGTQMTLKTFHFAGVASMNVTLGVPRIKEIINASKNISTPIITAPLMTHADASNAVAGNYADKKKRDDLIVARIIKGRVEKTCLGDISEYIQEIYASDAAYIKIKLNVKAMKALQLDVDVFSVESALLKSSKLKIKGPDIILGPPDYISIRVPSRSNENPYMVAQQLKRLLPKVVLHGIPSVSRAVIHDNNDGTYCLFVEGTGLLQVMTTPGVDSVNTVSNHVMEVQKVLGIEAARTTIAEQIQETMSKHGMTIDWRHVMLLADIMTYKGEVLGITRFGVSKMKDSVLMLASFEQTAEHLFTGAFHGKQDPILGVSECIIMGMQMPIGTGLFKILQNLNECRWCDVPEGSKQRLKKFVSSPGCSARKLLFDNAEFHPR